jgi:hypothetical protein
MVLQTRRYGFYLKEDLKLNLYFLPMIIEGEKFVKCAAFDDIIRGRKEIE